MIAFMFVLIFVACTIIFSTILTGSAAFLSLLTATGTTITLKKVLSTKKDKLQK